jgi:predicted RNase H-like HicB family nuclease
VTRSTRTFRVRYECDDDGTWDAEVIEEPLVRVRGRTLAALETNIRKALARALSAEEAVKVTGADLTLQPQFDFPEADLIGRVVRQREVARRAEADVETLTTDAAHQLVDRRKLSLRDAAYLLGVSQVRVKQLLGGAAVRAAT